MVELRRYFFFVENTKNLGRSDDAKQRRKRDALSDKCTENFKWF